MRSNRKAALFAAGLPLAALAALLAVFVMWAPGSGGGRSAEAATDPSVGFSMTSAGCSSNGSPTATCTVDAGATFTVAFNLDSLPSNGSFDGYDTKFNFSSGLIIPGLPTPSSSDFCQTNSGACASGPLSGNWPDCVFNASDFTSTPGQVSAACAIGIGGTSSTYTGALYHLNFTCPTPATTQQTITLLGGDNNTDTVDNLLAPHSQPNDETLTITCGAAGEPTVTPTPCEPNCPTPTDTPIASPTQVAPTPTRTPAGACGDANGDGSVDSLDALWVLWLDAGLVTQVARPELADLNHDSTINSIDASVILQVDAGLFTCTL